MSKSYRNFLYFIQVMIGWEFFVSGWNKLVSVGLEKSFPAQLADALQDQIKGLDGWYINFLKSTVIPHAALFGYLVEWGETLAGIALIAGALIFIFKKMEDGPFSKALSVLHIVSMAGVAFMSLNFWLLAGAPSFLPGGQDPNGEGFTLDAFLTILPIVFIWFNAVVLRSSARKMVKEPMNTHLHQMAK